MNIKTQKTVVNIFAVLIFLVAFSWLSNDDYKEQIKAQEHANYVRELAKQEADERKAEFNRLAFEGERMTGFAGDMP